MTRVNILVWGMHHFYPVAEVDTLIWYTDKFDFNRATIPQVTWKITYASNFQYKMGSNHQKLDSWKKLRSTASKMSLVMKYAWFFYCSVEFESRGILWKRGSQWFRKMPLNLMAPSGRCSSGGWCDSLLHDTELLWAWKRYSIILSVINQSIKYQGRFGPHISICWQKLWI